MPRTLGESLDQIISIPLRTGTASVEREPVRHFYEVARERQGGQPLAMQAAQRLVDVVHEGDWVFLMTGIAETPWLRAGETAGPPGIVSLARAIAYGLKAQPLYLAEPLTMPTVTEPSKAIGVPVHDPEIMDRFGIWRAAGAIEMPLGPENARERAIELLDRYQPKALIACEKLGPNAYGEYAIIDGQMPPNLVDHVAAELFHEARRRGILTIGSGNGGDELGLGVVEDVTNSYYGPTDYRKGGRGTAIRADVAVVTSPCNWGCYAVSAGIAYLTKTLEALHTPEMERIILEKCAAAGSIDFGSGLSIAAVDGYSLEVNQAVVTLLRRAVEGRLKERAPAFVPSQFATLVYEWSDLRRSGDHDLSTWL